VICIVWLAVKIEVHGGGLWGRLGGSLGKVVGNNCCCHKGPNGKGVRVSNVISASGGWWELLLTCFLIRNDDTHKDLQSRCSALLSTAVPEVCISAHCVQNVVDHRNRFHQLPTFLKLVSIMSECGFVLIS
jgi:hypothetical protein